MLQRQFFEAIVRAAMIKYANDTERVTLSQKLDSLFENHLKPLAGKNKAKTADEEVSDQTIARSLSNVDLNLEKLQNHPASLR